MLNRGLHQVKPCIRGLPVFFIQIVYFPHVLKKKENYWRDEKTRCCWESKSMTFFFYSFSDYWFSSIFVWMQRSSAILRKLATMSSNIKLIGKWSLISKGIFFDESTLIFIQWTIFLPQHPSDITKMFFEWMKNYSWRNKKKVLESKLLFTG